MKTIRTIIVFKLVLTSLFISAQSTFYDDDSDEYNQFFSFTIGGFYKPNHGTTIFKLGIEPVKNIEFYIAPSYSLLFGGYDMFAGVRFYALKKHRLFINSDFAYRHSYATGVVFENRESGKTESYSLPNTNYLSFGLGLSLKMKESDQLDKIFEPKYNLTLTYNYALENYSFTYGEGPFSQQSIDAMNNRIGSGIGLIYTISFYIPTLKRDD